MPAMTEVTCKCGTVFQARTADVKRGWGKNCSKACAKTKTRRPKPASRPIPLISMIERAQRRNRIEMADCEDCGGPVDFAGDRYCSVCDFHNEPQMGWDEHKSY